MADLSSKQLQDFLDAQSDSLNELFIRLENSQRNQSKQLNDSIDKLIFSLNQKFDRLSTLADKNNNSGFKDQDISKLSASIDNLATRSEALGKQVEQNSRDNQGWVGNLMDTFLKIAKTVTTTIEASYEATSNQLNFNRQMEVNGVLSTYYELREAARLSGISLNELSEVSGKFKNVMISLNAAGHRGVKAFQEMGTEVFKQFNKENISFTQKDTYEIEGAVLESARKMGKLHEMSESEIKKQTYNTGKIIDSLSKLVGMNRSEMLQDIAKGPSILAEYALKQRGASAESIQKFNAVMSSIKGIFGEEGARILEKRGATGVNDQEFSQTFGIVNQNLGLMMDELMNAAVSGEILGDKFEERYLRRLRSEGDAYIKNFENIGLPAASMTPGSFPYKAAIMNRQLTQTREKFGQKLDDTKRPGGAETRAAERAETLSMLSTQTTSQRQLTTASNNLRDSLMSVTDSAEKLDWASRKLFQSYEDLTTRVNKIIRSEFGDEGGNVNSLKLRTAEGKKWVDEDEQSQKDSKKSKEKTTKEWLANTPIAQQIRGIWSEDETLGGNLTNLGNTMLDVGMVTSMSGELASSVKSIIRGADTASDMSKVAATAGKATKGWGSGLGYLSAGIEGVQAIDSFADGNNKEGWGHLGSGSLDALATAALAWPPYGTAIGAAYLLADAVMGMFTEKGLGQTISEGVYDSLTKNQLLDIKDIDKTTNVNNHAGDLAMAPDLHEITNLLQRQVTATEDVGRKLNNVNIYQNV